MTHVHNCAFLIYGTLAACTPHHCPLALRQVQALAVKHGLVCREAFHYREHPLAQRYVPLPHAGCNHSCNPTMSNHTTWLQPLAPQSKHHMCSLRELVHGKVSDTPAVSGRSLPTWAATPAAAAPASSTHSSGVLGRLISLHVDLLIPAWVFGGANIRYQESLAGW